MNAWICVIVAWEGRATGKSGKLLSLGAPDYVCQSLRHTSSSKGHVGMVSVPSPRGRVNLSVLPTPTPPGSQSVRSKYISSGKSVFDVPFLPQHLRLQLWESHVLFTPPREEISPSAFTFWAQATRWCGGF